MLPRGERQERRSAGGPGLQPGESRPDNRQEVARRAVQGSRHERGSVPRRRSTEPWPRVRARTGAATEHSRGFRDLLFKIYVFYVDFSTAGSYKRVSL